MCVDRFADKYPSLTPYQYAANNPMLFVDVNGDSIQITDSQTQQDFINSLPKNVSEYIRFSNDGVLDIAYLVSSLGDIELSSLGINLQAAILIGQNEQMVSLEGSKEFQFADENGKVTTYTWDYAGFTGFTTAPDGSKYQSAIPGVVDVRYNNNMSDLKRVRAIGHELFAHARFYLQGKKWEHDYRPGYGGQDFNVSLYHAIRKHQIKSIVNYLMR